MRNRPGTGISGPEQDVVVVYEKLRRLLEEHPGELPPYLERNVVKALACLWQVMHGLGMEPRPLRHAGR
ncbi:hypothetical protein AB0E62_23590 [Streptomyces sp. NPDC038707]|uniref:hypothetical protein n=1 Tax=unclassified Streptomyces TaxID=2593676 RepID=UPI0033FA4D65